MAILSIHTRPAAVLRKKAKKVSSTDNAVQRLIDDMIATMRAASGVGLAAPQVGISLQIAVIEIPDEEVITLINPEIIKTQGECLLTEACLSIPGYQGQIKRSVKVKVKAQDRQGKIFRIAGEELLAQALEHEIDHLNGILYIDHLESPEDLHQISLEDGQM